MDLSAFLPAFFELLVAARKRVTWLIVFLPVSIKKLVWPVVDLRNGRTQSRNYYHRLEYEDGNTKISVYQEIDSNGNVTRHVTAMGDQTVLPLGAEPRIVAEFQHPRVQWRRKIDWCDVFNGSLSTGCHAISDPRLR